MTIQELREKRAKAWDTARDFLDSKRQADGTLTEEDSKTYDTLEKQIVDLGREIQRLERQAEIDAEMSRPTSTPIKNVPGTHIETEKTGRASAEYNTAFWNNIRNRNYVDVRNDLQVGTDSEGGFLVPDEFEKKLIAALEEENVFRPLATKIQTSSGDRKIPIVTSKGEAAWLEEEEAYSLSDDTFGQISLSAYKVGTAIKISEELLNDSVFDLPAYITKEFARRIGAKEEEAFIIGDGIGKPTGIFANTGGAENGATSAGATLTFDDVMELFYSVKSPYRKKAVWLMNEQTLKMLRKVKDSTGNYIWSPGVQAGVPDTIFNRPYVTSVYAPLPNAGNKAIAFGDFGYYWIADRQGRSMKRLNEVQELTQLLMPLQDQSHIHENAEILDSITAEKIAQWDNAGTTSSFVAQLDFDVFCENTKAELHKHAQQLHSHANKAVIDAITTDKVSSWNMAATLASELSTEVSLQRNRLSAVEQTLSGIEDVLAQVVEVSE